MGGPKRQYSPNDYLTTGQVADVLGLNERTLRNWRARGKGPPFFRLEGSIRYRFDRLTQWMEAHQQRPAPAPPPNRSA